MALSHTNCVAPVHHCKRLRLSRVAKRRKWHKRPNFYGGADRSTLSNGTENSLNVIDRAAIFFLWYGVWFYCGALFMLSVYGRGGSSPRFQRESLLSSHSKVAEGKVDWRRRRFHYKLAWVSGWDYTKQWRQLYWISLVVTVSPVLK
jgi:hypothetical protein